jgi:hypothetical protein
MKHATWTGFVDGDLQPVVGAELTATGWRGITADGEILEVQSSTGVPESIMMFSAGELVGQRKVSAQIVSVTDYLDAFNASAVLHRNNHDAEALTAIEQAIAIVPTARARFNRAMILLALGHWLEGFEEFELCEREPPFQRPAMAAALALGKQPWRGESLEGKRLLLLHDHGFGDTIMMLRFVEALRRHGAQVIQCVPSELEWLALQFGDVVDLRCPCDYFVSYLQLLRWLRIVPCSVPIAPYIRVSGDWKVHWREQLGPAQHKRVGVAWSVRTEHSGDFPRPLPLQQIAVWFPDAELHSVQKQGVEEAAANGVATHELLDFASTAALMMQMDEIVTVDTAAAHLAGAIGHPNVTLMLSQWHSWRWHDNPFYPHVRIVESGR